MYLTLVLFTRRTLILTIGHQRMHAMIYSQSSFEPFRNEKIIEHDFLLYVFDEPI